MIEKATDNFRNTRGYAALSVYFVCCLLIGLIAFFDLATPLGIAIGVLYVVVVLLSFWSPTTKFTYAVAMISSVLIVGVFLYKPPVAEMWKVVFNRSLSLFVIWVTTFLGMEIKGTEQKLLEMATHDFLTGLLNRREMFNRLSLEVSRVNRTNEPLSVIMIDIDHFKNVNDTYGHTSGDMVLIEIARRLREGMRHYDLICRYGGEEFLVVAPETTVQRAHELAERLRMLVSEHLLDVEATPPISITISAGVTQLVAGESVEEMLSRSDTALYRAKELGRNRVVVL
jgi:diguanylate cyclase (GGDEF)-like protein